MPAPTNLFAERPWRLSVSDWRQVVGRVWQQRSEDDLSARAAAIAFSALFAIPTLLIAVVSIYGLISSPADVESLIESVSSVLPASAADLLANQLQSITSETSSALSFGAVAGLAGAVWSVSGGVNRLRETVNEVYGEVDDRPWYVKRAWSIAASLGVIAAMIVAVGLIAFLPSFVSTLDIGGGQRTILLIGRWALLSGLMVGLLGALYRIGPKRSAPRLPWITVGTALAVVGFLVMSVGFGIYAQNFASYNETYGSLGSVVVFMTWLYLAAYIVLLAGELNAELEHQTLADTTVEGDQPLGQRGAHVADNVPEDIERDHPGVIDSLRANVED